MTHRKIPLANLDSIQEHLDEIIPDGKAMVGPFPEMNKDTEARFEDLTSTSDSHQFDCPSIDLFDYE